MQWKNSPQTSNTTNSLLFSTYAAGLQQIRGGLAPINSLTDAKLHASIPAHPPVSPCTPWGVGRTCFFLSRDAGGRVLVTPWLAPSAHTLTRRCIRPTEIHSQAGDLLHFVVLSLYFFLVAQQCLVWTGEWKKKPRSCTYRSWLKAAVCCLVHYLFWSK